MLVTVCTITFNRRAFIPSMIRCFQKQDYTGDVEWIILDDGTDSIEDLVSSVPQVRYVRLETKQPIGKKRNMTHAMAKGDILVYMDDDDYYPPNRISHAVETLGKSDALCAGSSIVHVYFDHIRKIIEFGPYGPNHATAGTFAMKRELLSQTAYDETACMAEEKHFLKNYTIPMVQLDPTKTILVVSHLHNTFDKKKLLVRPSPMVRETDLQLTHFIQDPASLHFFKSINLILAPSEVTVDSNTLSTKEAANLIVTQHRRIQELTKEIHAQRTMMTTLLNLTKDR